ncbi:MAG: CD225/dispanin family protein, partial [Desulfatibacillaceae bacterium]|nr:CD225/dispanin family protein [Desulfatibacillaceae bacterium]
CSKCGALLGDFALPPENPLGQEAGTFPQTVYNPENFPAPRPSQYPVTMRTYLIPAILVTLFCCIPFGIPAIVHASIARSKFAEGDFDEGAARVKKARFWVWMGFGSGLAFLVLYFFAGFGEY